MADEENTTHSPGERVKVVLPDPDGPDAKYDGREATVVEVSHDELGIGVNQPELNEMYRLRFDNGEEPGLGFRVHDLESVDN